MSRDIIAIASDHAGVELKASLAAYISDQDYDVLDLGANGPESVDYPDFGFAVASAVEGGRARFGVLVCGTGIGISIAANRHLGVRAAVCHDVTTARLARQHNDANVIAMGARIIGAAVAVDCLSAFLTTGYEGGRHDRRVAKLGAPIARTTEEPPVQ